MPKHSPRTHAHRRASWCASAAMAVLLALPAVSSAQNYEASLERGSHPDVTAQQRYQTAIREAGGGLKLSLAACREEASNRKACEREARARYREDMEYARALRANPQMPTTQAPITPIESTEITTIRTIPAK